MSTIQLMKHDGITPPVAKPQPKELSVHGHTRIDEYYWLNERENPEVIAYLNAENAYLEQVMAPVKDFEEKLFQEMKSRIQEQDESVPVKEGNYFYYYRYMEGGEYPIYCRKKESLNAPEEILLDGNKLGKAKPYFNIGGYEITDNDEVMAYGIDTVSRRNYTVRFKNLKTGKLYKEQIKNTEGGYYAWAADNKTFFYIRRDQQTLLGYQVWRHELGTDVKTDVLVYEEKDNQFYMGLYRMKSKKYIAISCDHNGVSTEYRLLEAAKPLGEFKVFAERERGHEYVIEHLHDKFYIRTNQNKAANFKLLEVKENEAADKTKWKEVIAHRKDVFLESMEVFTNHLVLQERREGLIQLRVINQTSGNDHYIEFSEPAYDAYIGTNPDFNTHVLRYIYTSLTTPGSTFDYNLDTREVELKKQQAVLGDFNKNNYVSERVFATARDGVKVPVSIVYRKDTLLNGTAPLLQYSYGSYGYSTDATFSSVRLSLLDRGFVYAIAHIRGGQEMGREWYDSGKMFNKKNTFYDFIDCSRFLIANQYCSPAKLFAMGGSAGGLLMGAINNMQPDLYKGIVAAVPFVDVVTTMLDESIPLTTGEFEEWGNPKNKASYDYMLSYSPYDNIDAKDYPNMLITTGLHDSQVQYFEPAKWVARLRTRKTDQNLLLLYTDMEAGHGGASGRFSSLKLIAKEYVFMLDLANALH
ncbi:S9 family peptidase [Emticicia fluvialis]|uniref:S9 family peptidase n=1 Tax=Emticicia fluvialis TaxID=2974474 RepID=UPI002166AA8D|nr:S9 family peptidase [Emticicia fluvialis]